ncbi:MAG: hypothetical protein AAB263_00435 [Planctomycetota bacterium]
MSIKRRFVGVRRALLLSTTLVASVSLVSTPAWAACYTVNQWYYYQSIGQGTECIFNYNHGNAWTTAYSQIQRLSAPPGYPYYCGQAGTRAVGTGWVSGPVVQSTTTVQQSSVPGWTNLIYSTTYAYYQGTSYYQVDNSPFC